MDGRRGRRRESFRKGLSMLEVVLALVIMAGVFAAISQSFMGASHQAREMESRLKEAMLSQMILEQIRDRIRVNDYEFQQLIATAGKQSHFGLVVAQQGSADSPASTMTVNPFFEHLFALGGGPLYGEGQRAGLDRKDFVGGASLPAAAGTSPALRKTDLSLLAQNYQNFACRVTIEDSPLPPLAGASPPGGFKELLKTITIEVHRLRDGTVGPDGRPPFRVETKIVCPVASVSDGSFLDLDRAVYDDGYEDNLAEVMGELRSHPNFGSYDEKTREMLGKLFLVLQEVNNEAYLIEGGSGPALGEKDDGYKCLNDWITDFRGSELPMFKKELAQAYERRAVLIMRHFRKFRKALFAFRELHGTFMGEIDKAMEELTAEEEYQEDDGQGGFRTATRTVIHTVSLAESWQTTDPTVQLVCRAKALKEFVKNEQYKPLLERLHAYPIRFAGNLALAQEVYQGFLKSSDLAPNDEMEILKRWVEAFKARRLFDYKVRNRSSDPVAAFEKAYEPSFRSFSTYFAREEIKDPDRLKRRNARYLEEAKAMKTLLPPSWWAALLREYEPTGKVENFLNTYTRVSGTWGLARGRVLSQLADEMRDMRREMMGMNRALNVKVDSEIERILREGLSEL